MAINNQENGSIKVGNALPKRKSVFAESSWHPDTAPQPNKNLQESFLSIAAVLHYGMTYYVTMLKSGHIYQLIVKDGESAINNILLAKNSYSNLKDCKVLRELAANPATLSNTTNERITMAINDTKAPTPQPEVVEIGKGQMLHIDEDGAVTAVNMQQKEHDALQERLEQLTADNARLKLLELQMENDKLKQQRGDMHVPSAAVLMAAAAAAAIQSAPPTAAAAVAVEVEEADEEETVEDLNNEIIKLRKQNLKLKKETGKGFVTSFMEFFHIPSLPPLPEKDTRTAGQIADDAIANLEAYSSKTEQRMTELMAGW